MQKDERLKQKYILTLKWLKFEKRIDIEEKFAILDTVHTTDPHKGEQDNRGHTHRITNMGGRSLYAVGCFTKTPFFGNSRCARRIFSGIYLAHSIMRPKYCILRIWLYLGAYLNALNVNLEKVILWNTLRVYSDNNHSFLFLGHCCYEKTEFHYFIIHLFAWIIKSLLSKLSSHKYVWTGLIKSGNHTHIDIDA